MDIRTDARARLKTLLRCYATEVDTLGRATDGHGYGSDVLAVLGLGQEADPDQASGTRGNRAGPVNAETVTRRC